jgi:TP901 family phage tail tape measure protein
VALSARELLLVLRARDEATRVVRGLVGAFGDVDNAAMAAARNQISAGSGLISLGAGFAAVGIASLGWMKGSIDQATEFEKSIAKVETQLDKTAGSQKELADAVKRTAADIAVPIEQMTDAFYDIFSSMDVTVPQAESLLRSFSKEAVAGQVDLQTAARATIGILNGFHLKVEDVTRVQDVQFQLVRKGVGTYEQFSQVLGRATPSAARAGQSIETLAGMLAYMTRNGLSAAMAAASAGRAFDAFANPKVVKRLEDMGVAVRDAKGEFKPMADVMVDLQKKLANLTAPERAEALQALFKGAGGTIQARRFYDMVLKDSQSVQQFVGLVGDMNNAQGAFGHAYEIMADTTASRSQLLKNQWQLLRIEVGEALIPVFQQLMTWLGKLLQMWNSIGEGTKKQIIIWIAIASALMVVLGFVIAVAGAVMVLAGAAAAVGLSLGALLAIFGLIILAIAAVIAVAIVLAKNWDSVSSALKASWEAFWAVLKNVWDWIYSVIGKQMVDLWHRVSDDIIDAVKAVGVWVSKVWGDIVAWAKEVWPGVQRIIEPVVQWLVEIWPYVQRSLEAVLHLLADTFEAAWDAIVAVVKGAWEILSGVLEGVFHILEGIIEFIVGVFTLNWSMAWEGIKKIFQGVWEIIAGIVTGAWTIISGLFMAALKLIWSIVKNGLDLVVEVFDGGLKLILHLWDAIWGWIVDVLKGTFNGIISGVKAGWKAVTDFFNNMYWDTVNFFKNAWNWLVQAGKDIINGLIHGIQLAVSTLWDTLGNITKNIPMVKGPIAKDRKLLFNSGVAIMTGFIEGLVSEYPTLLDFLSNVATDVSGEMNGEMTASGTTSLGAPLQTSGSNGATYNNIYNQSITVNTQEIDPRREAAELGHELFRGPG